MDHGARGSAASPFALLRVGTSKYKDKELRRESGWYAAAEYKLEHPGLLFWYSSGDDAKWFRASPSIDPDGCDFEYGGAPRHFGTWLYRHRCT